MALFGKKKKPAPAQSGPELIWEKTFRQSSSFKGFKRIRLTTYNEPGVEESLAFFDGNFRDRTIQLMHYRLPGVFTDGDAYVVNVYVDAKRIGCVYGRNSGYDMLTGNDFDKVHVRTDNGDVYLFIHLV